MGISARIQLTTHLNLGWFHARLTLVESLVFLHDFPTLHTNTELLFWKTYKKLIVNFTFFLCWSVLVCTAQRFRGTFRFLAVVTVLVRQTRRCGVCVWNKYIGIFTSSSCSQRIRNNILRTWWRFYKTRRPRALSVFHMRAKMIEVPIGEAEKSDS